MRKSLQTCFGKHTFKTLVLSGIDQIAKLLVKTVIKFYGIYFIASDEISILPLNLTGDYDVPLLCFNALVTFSVKVTLTHLHYDTSVEEKLKKVK